MTLWIGQALGPIERACMRSVLHHGHSLALYCYAPPAGVPDGVELRDAASILAQERVFEHRSGSVALFADWFRCELQKRGSGTWIDADVYLVAPLDFDASHLFGEESPGVINNAVLRLPPDSPILPPLLEVFEQGRTPWWLPLHQRLLYGLASLGGRRTRLSRLPWASTGPTALTALAGRFALNGLALPSEVLNPVHWRRSDWIRNPAIALEEVITERTVAVHLWNRRIASFKNEPAPAGSFLHRLQAEGTE